MSNRNWPELHRILRNTDPVDAVWEILAPGRTLPERRPRTPGLYAVKEGADLDQVSVWHLSAEGFWSHLNLEPVTWEEVQAHAGGRPLTRLIRESERDT